LGNPTSGVTVRFSVTGSVTTSGPATTNASGQATFCYTGPTLPGADAITAFADTNNDGVQGAEPSGAATKTWVAGAPATLTLTPATATNPVGTSHTVTATVKDAFGNPTPGITVRFKVTGSVTPSGSCTTAANGQCSFTYQGPTLPGADAITAYADTNNNGVQDAGEPGGVATKTWVLPVTTPLCQIIITNGGRITAANGDKATFGGNAQSSATGETKGNEEYKDHGPAQPLKVQSLNVLAIVCEGTTQASIYGQATIDGAGSFFYRINVKDLADPGAGQDTYWILLSNGYNSGEQKLEAGNVKIRRTQ
jgi:Big-like domain-containing protein